MSQISTNCGIKPYKSFHINRGAFAYSDILQGLIRGLLNFGPRLCGTARPIAMGSPCHNQNTIGSVEPQLRADH